jgi:hypothetical protein
LLPSFNVNGILNAITLACMLSNLADFQVLYFQPRSQTARQKAPAKSITSEPTRRPSRAVASKSQSHAEDGYFLPRVLDNSAVKIARAPRETLPTKQEAVIPWAEEFRFEDEASKENSEDWFWKIRGNSEYKGKESKVQRLAHRLGDEGRNFQSVREITTWTDEVLSVAFASPPKLGPKSCLLPVLKEVQG